MKSAGSSSFGGKWSDEKLAALHDYLGSYTQALKKTSFKLAYIDAFAGAGLREVESDDKAWFDEEFKEEDEKYRHGSPLIALGIDPPFDAFVFIESDPKSMTSLQEQVTNAAKLNGRNVSYLQGDANEHISALTEKNWKGHRAVAFLDPFALHVTWETLEKIASTKAIDMWLLFPAMAVNRMLPKSGKVPKKWAERLTLLFGEDGWRDAFYHKKEANLFGDEESEKVSGIFDALSEYVTKRLQSIFAGTHTKPLVLRNKSGAPLFLLCFACGNPKGAKIATRIASHIIDKTSHGK